MVIGLCDRALVRKARAENIRTRISATARDFAPKPHAHGPVARPCVEAACPRPGIDHRQLLFYAQALFCVPF